MRAILARGVAAALVTVGMWQGVPFETPLVGGVGGSPFADRCGPNEAMAGISALVAGTDVTAIGIICQPVDARGALGTAGLSRRRHGGTPATGTAVAAQCPRGQVLRGVAVYYRDAVRGLGLYCRVWETTAFGAGGGAGETIGTTGGTMAPVTCPPDGTQPAVGLAGTTTTTRVAGVRLICDRPRR
jgi:hypothetical protein